jgi:hypothetical protein
MAESFDVQPGGLASQFAGLDLVVNEEVFHHAGHAADGVLDFAGMADEFLRGHPHGIIAE